MSTPADTVRGTGSGVQHTESTDQASAELQVHHWVEHAAHFLPTQGPINVFVHHNTLHALEALPFEKAVVEGYQLFGSEPYLSEQRYRDEYKQGRIRLSDLRSALMDDLADSSNRDVAGLGTRYSLRLSLLTEPIHNLPPAEIKWLVLETGFLERYPIHIRSGPQQQAIQETRQWICRDWQEVTSPTKPLVAQLLQRYAVRHPEQLNDSQWESFTLHCLWQICLTSVSAHSRPPMQNQHGRRHRDALYRCTGVDPDVLVNELLIRFCGAFVDQGFAGWKIPYRQDGLLSAFIELYSRRFCPLPRWLRGLRSELHDVKQAGVKAADLILRTLDQLDVPIDEREDYVLRTLLALRGWAGMLWQLERSVPWAPVTVPPGTLLEFLAIRLLLDKFAARFVARDQLNVEDLGQLKTVIDNHEPGRNAGELCDPRSLVIFQLAQARGWHPKQLWELPDQHWRDLINEVTAFDSLERRRIFQSAYENRYHTNTLDTLAFHCKRRLIANEDSIALPDYQIVCCIDDREESFRRHLEEVDPACATYGAAGFYGVVMYYQGATHAHYRPLCPAVVTPKHYVREEPVFSAVDLYTRRTQRRRILGSVTHYIHSGSRTLIGGLVTGVFGSLATFPLVARVLAPRLTAKIRESASSLVQPPTTELHIERVSDEPGTDADSLGFDIQEMAEIVLRVLSDIGLRASKNATSSNKLARMIVFFGHGSSSLNNPHESAYSCGACSGGRGGPNARAFAIMANDPRVRAAVAAGGLDIPADTWFVGGYHNTCNDLVEYYDLDRIPRSHRDLFRRIERHVGLAAHRNAHERARRFESIPLGLSTKEAFDLVQQRAEDLSEARPEYNHATNALCFVGDRRWSRSLFLDRRAFLTSYDPDTDDDQSTILGRILQAVIPVCAGISLEYYFSTVDNEGYGCGSKLPHNIASLLGVMTGASSDLRTGLSAQMVEIHEPMRILFVVETTCESMQTIIDRSDVIRRLVQGNWVKIALLDSKTGTIQRYHSGTFENFDASQIEMNEVASSIEWYRGLRENLPFAVVKPRSETRGQDIEAVSHG